MKALHLHTPNNAKDLLTLYPQAAALELPNHELAWAGKRMISISAQQRLPSRLSP